MVSQQDLDELIIVSNHPKYKLIFNKDGRFGKYEIYEFSKMFDQHNKENIYSRFVEYFDNLEDALMKFASLNNETKITIISSGSID